MICFLHYDILAKNCSAVTTDRGSEIATLRSDDGNEIVKEAIGFEKQNNNFARALHDHEMKMPNFTFYRGRQETSHDEIFLLFLNVDVVLRNWTPGEFAYI